MSTSLTAPEFDFIVVGAGGGGGPVACNLAKHDFRVLLIEAGGRDYPQEARVPAFHPLASEHNDISWEFFVRHYADAEMQRKDSKFDERRGGVFYPRATGLGGCTIHNAMITLSGPADDWDAIAGVTGDRSWNSERMRAYFEKLENCHYARRPGQRSRNPLRRLLDALRRALGSDTVNPGRHGFSGWLHTTLANPRLVLPDRVLLAQLLGAFWATNAAQLEDLTLLLRQLVLGGIGARLDPNHWERLQKRPEGLALVPMSVANGERSSVRDLILETENTRPDHLHVLTDALVTEVLFDSDRGHHRATGVRLRRGARLYRAHPNPSRAAARDEDVFCRYEVILSGGAFNTPQILMRSGIGPAGELARHGIPLRVDLPGVGTNLQDRYEVCVVIETPKDFTILKDLKFRPDPSDPAFATWERSRTGLYATNGAVLAILKKSRPDLAWPDLCVFGLPGDFRGYRKGYSTAVSEHKNRFTWAILKAYTRNRGGTVRLASADPLDPPEIDFRYFGEGSDRDRDDLDALVAGIKFVRSFLKWVPKSTRELVPGPQYRTDDQLREFVAAEAWGHHASCSCPIGADGDPMAVLDTEFRVRGVSRLRVVDASAFPTIPGVFIAANVYMLSEKASDVIVAAYRGRRVSADVEARLAGTSSRMRRSR